MKFLTPLPTLIAGIIIGIVVWPRAKGLISG